MPATDYTHLNAMHPDLGLPISPSDVKQATTPGINEKICCYLEFLSSQCKTCFRKSAYNCGKCIIEDATPLLKEFRESLQQCTQLVPQPVDEPCPARGTALGGGCVTDAVNAAEEAVIEDLMLRSLTNYLRCVDDWVTQQDLTELAMKHSKNTKLIGKVMLRLNVTRRGKHGKREYRIRRR